MRWKPDARGRLEQAAYALFLERGYAETTVADIAERAGLTERTFFRHYADKREVLFGGSVILEEELHRTIDALPPDMSTIASVQRAVEAVSRLMHGRRAVARDRQRIVAADGALRERGLIKRATLTAVMTRALEARGVAEPAASLAADMGIAVFYIGFETWLDDPAERELVDIVRESFDQLRAVVAET